MPHPLVLNSTIRTFAFSSFLLAGLHAEDAAPDAFDQLAPAVVYGDPIGRMISSPDLIEGDTLDQLGIVTSRDAVKLIPNVGQASADSFRATSFSVRGSRELTFHEYSGGRTGVGFYLDDMPVTDAYGRDLAMFEVEEFRFFKGPHGTAMGVPHSMGVADVRTRQPEGTARGRLSYRLGNYDSHEIKAHLSGALTEHLYFGLDGLFATDNGWFEDRLTGRDYGKHETLGGRARLRWVPNDNLELDLTIGTSHHDDDPPVYLRLDAPGDPYRVFTSPEAYSTGEQNYQVLRAVWKGEDWQFKSITSHRQVEFTDDDPAFLQNAFNPGRLPRFRDQEIDFWSQEFRLESTDADAAWKWRAGAFLSTRDSRLDHFMIGLGPWEGANEIDYRFDDYALYGELTHVVNDCLELSAGLRLQTLRDRTKSTFVPTSFAESIGGSAMVTDESDTFSAILPMVAARWAWNDTQTSYFRFSTGIQPGGLAVASGGSRDYDSQDSFHYEIGHDGIFAEGEARFHVAAFYTDYDHYQSFRFHPMGNTIYNADGAHAFGIEAEVDWTPVEGLNLYVGVGWTKAEYDDFVSPLGDFSGNRINNIPEATVNLGGEYRTSWGGLARIDWRLVGDTWFDDGNTAKQNAYSTLGARIGYECENFGIYLYGSNLLDTEYFSQAYLFQGVPTGALGIPRLFGLEVRATF